MQAEAALEQLELTYGAARMNLRGVDEELALEPPGEGGNSINWIVGHVLAYRHRLLQSLGREPTAGEELLAPYGPESRVSWTPERAVPLEKLGELLNASQTALSSRLEARRASESGGSAEPAGLSFYLFHEAYHVGQIALARRCLGLPGVIEPSDAPGAGRNG